MTELMIILPVFLMLLFGTISIVYMLWQGIKVQQAANFAARVQSQEHVQGGRTVTGIERMNGYTEHGLGGGDEDPAQFLQNMQNADSQNLATDLRRRHHAPRDPISVYGKIYQKVQGMFGAGERNNLFIPRPTTQIITDRVKVSRVFTPPPIFGLKFRNRDGTPIRVEAVAYGGEDVHMYALPRWGRTDPGETGLPYWDTLVRQSDQGRRQRLQAHSNTGY